MSVVYVDEYLDVNVYVYVDVDKLERKIAGGHLMQSRAICLITTHYQPMYLVDVLYFKLNHRQEIVSY